MKNAQRHLQFPPPPRPPKPPVERWTIEFSGHDTGVPVVCRIRRLLKAAWRGYSLRAKVIVTPSATTPAPLEPSPPATTPPPESTHVSTDAPNGPQTAFNEAAGSVNRG